MWSFIWNSGIVNPMTNLLLVLYDLLGNNFFLALIAFTALIRLAMLPLSMRQQRSTMKTQEIQPQIQAIQKKYKDDPARMQQEFQKIGYNPAESLAGCLPLLIQMPIFFGLYRAIRFVLISTPQGVYELSERAYDFVNLTELLPISNRALWMNMGQPDPLFVLPFLVAGTMYLSQKLVMPPKDPSKDKDSNPAAAMQQQMMVTMPLMFGFFSLNFPAGLSIYFVVSNLISMIQGIILRRNKENLKVEQDASKKSLRSTASNTLPQPEQDGTIETAKKPKAANKSPKKNSKAQGGGNKAKKNKNKNKKKNNNK